MTAIAATNRISHFIADLPTVMAEIAMQTGMAIRRDYLTAEIPLIEIGTTAIGRNLAIAYAAIGAAATVAIYRLFTAGGAITATDGQASARSLIRGTEIDLIIGGAGRRPVD